MKKANIFLIHHAGGSRYSYQFITSYFHRFVVHPLELPGRGNRTREPLIGYLPDAVSDIYNQIKLSINPGRDVIWGHSMGALLGFFVTSHLEKNNLFPRQLIVSGSSGPGSKDKELLHNLPKEELKSELLRLGGLPREVIQNNELFEFYEPIIRTDLKLAESANEITNVKLAVPVYGIMGTNEKTADQIENWRNYTTGEFNSCLFEGNHFFIHDHSKNIAELITGLAGHENNNLVAS